MLFPSGAEHRLGQGDRVFGGSQPCHTPGEGHRERHLPSGTGVSSPAPHAAHLSKRDTRRPCAHCKVRRKHKGHLEDGHAVVFLCHISYTGVSNLEYTGHIWQAPDFGTGCKLRTAFQSSLLGKNEKSNSSRYVKMTRNSQSGVHQSSFPRTGFHVCVCVCVCVCIIWGCSPAAQQSQAVSMEI